MLLVKKMKQQCTQVTPWDGHAEAVRMGAFKPPHESGNCPPTFVCSLEDALGR